MGRQRRKARLPALRQATYPRDRNPAAVYLRRLGAGSRESCASSLQQMARILTGGRLQADQVPWHLLRYHHTTALRSKLMEEYAPASVNRMVSNLRGVLKEAWRLGVMTAEDYQRAADLKQVRFKRTSRGRALTRQEIDLLLAEPDSVRGRRDRALLAVLYGAGLRRSEAVRLEVADYEFETGKILVRSGKGQRDRTVYVANRYKALLERWIKTRGTEAGPLFLPIIGGGRLILKHMTVQAIYHLVRRMGNALGIREFTPHDLRRTFVTHLLEQGADVGATRELAGHANVQTTLLYDRRGEKAKRKAAELLT